MLEVGAFVMARGGSVGIPGKNLRPLAGLPLIAHTFRSAQSCAGVSRMFLSTDSEEIAAVGREYGVEVPFIRPPELARSDSPGFEALLHAVRWVIEHLNYRPDCVLELLPTSPLRTAQDIEQALAIMVEKQADSVVSVTEASQHPYWAKAVAEDGKLKHFFDTEFACRRRQDLPPAYALHGAIKLARTDVLLDRGAWYTDKTYAYVMPPERSVDVDTPWDLRLADLLMRENTSPETGGAE